jgi:hypothetical protein
MSGGAGSLLLLLLSVYLLLAYFTGRLEWLFSLGQDVAAGYTGAPPSPAATAYRPEYRYGIPG